jgi:uncharacterized protein YndB with AHSA1/START domain
MWNHESTIETTASPANIWRLFSDVPGWKKWNAGIEHIEIHGPFVTGTTFTMKPPEAEPFTSTLITVQENESFTDETVIDGTRVVVHHSIVPLPSGQNRIVYATEITGPRAEEYGTAVTSDFAEVLGALKALAELSISVKSRPAKTEGQGN